MELRVEGADHATMRDRGHRLAFVPLDDAEERGDDPLGEATARFSAREPKVEVRDAGQVVAQLGELLDHLLECQTLGVAEIHLAEAGHHDGRSAGDRGDRLSRAAGSLKRAGQEGVQRDALEAGAEFLRLALAGLVQGDVGGADEQAVDIPGRLAMAHEIQLGLAFGGVGEDVRYP